MPLVNGPNLHLQQARLTLAEALVVSDEVRPYYAAMWPDLEAFYRTHVEMPDAELMLSIDKEFGERLTKDVCIPLEFFQGACSFIALLLLRQSTPA